MLFIIIVFYFTYQSSQEFNFAAFAVIIYIVQKIFVYIQSGQNKLHNINAAVPYLQNVLRYQDEIEKHIEKNEGGKQFSFKNNIRFSCQAIIWMAQDNIGQSRFTRSVWSK